MQIPLPEIKTPLADTVLQIYTFKSKEGAILNSTFSHGQKVIMECILGRKAPVNVPLAILSNSGYEYVKRIHIMAHTRYGKSIAIASALSVRASSKKEPWAIVAGTGDQAQIIMDYVIQFSVNDPILKGLLVNEKEITIERMTQRRKRDHITYRFGGEIRAYGAGKDGTAVMGQGCPNVVEDESALLNDNTQSKIFRMLGDHMDNFYMKVGNPFFNNHFKRAFLDDNYFKINIDYRQGILDGRLTESFVSEVRKNPNFGVLYENIFPDEESSDEKGYYPLISHALLKRAMVEASSIDPWGAPRNGCDPADEGECESNIVSRHVNVAKIVYGERGVDPITFAGVIAVNSVNAEDSIVDRVGVGSGCYHLLSQQMQTKRKVIGFNGADKIPETVPKEEKDLYYNFRAYCYWQVKKWLESGGKLIADERWEKQLLAMRYKVKNGKILMISKEDLGKAPYNIKDLGVADCLSMTFAPKKKIFITPTVKGGIRPRFGGNIASSNN